MQQSTAINPTKRFLYLLVGPACLFISFLAFFVLLPRETPFWLASLILSLIIGLLVTKLASDEAADLLPAPEVIKVEIEKIRVEEKIRIEERIPEQIQQELHTLRQELQTLRDEREQTAKQFTLLKRSESKAQEKLAEIQSEFHLLNDRFTKEKNSLSKTVEELNEKISQSQQESNRLKNELKRIPELEEKLQQKLEEKVEPDAEARRWEGLYKQLRQQFEDKSNILNQTRRDLFIAHEKNEALSKEQQEIALQGPTPTEKMLQESLADLEERFHQLKLQHESDLEALESLVTNNV